MHPYHAFHSGHTDINNTEFSDNNLIVSEKERCDGMDEYNAYERIIKENLDYDTFIQNRHYDCRDIDKIIALMTDVTVCSGCHEGQSREGPQHQGVSSYFAVQCSRHNQ